MSSRRNQHVVPHGNAWAVRGAGADRATAIFDTKSEAVDCARSIAQHQRSELLVHGKDGQIQSCDSHGHDPFPPKG